jgi:hypothetical protein
MHMQLILAFENWDHQLTTVDGILKCQHQLDRYFMLFLVLKYLKILRFRSEQALFASLGTRFEPPSFGSTVLAGQCSGGRLPGGNRILRPGRRTAKKWTLRMA